MNIEAKIIQLKEELHLSTTTVSKIKLSSAVLMILCSDPFLQMWQ